CRRFGAGTGAFREGQYVVAWTIDQFRDAVLLPVPRGAFAASVDGIRRVAARFPVSGMIAGGSLWLGGLSPTMVEPVMEMTGLQIWMERIHEPLRLVVEPGLPSLPGCTWARLVSAEKRA
ncbi:MAG: hypothetical protein ACKPKO_23095, partial [Candidatus Fonsibacter sp.]